MAILAAVALVAAGCDWTIFGGFDVGNSRSTYEPFVSSTNVPTIRTAWSGAIGSSVGSSSPVTMNSRVFIGAQNGSVYAFDQYAATNCTAGTPGTCNPLWSSAPQGTPVSSPAVANNVVYIGAGGILYAYDANGSTNCSGSPVTCQPLWSTPSTGKSDMSTPNVFNGIVYVHDSTSLYAFDANGSTNCSGTPKVCQPLWSAPGVGSSSTLPPAIASGVVYTVGGGKLYAFDANGSTNCSGTPTVCQPLWSAPLAADQFGVVVAGGTAYTAGTNVYAYDAAGSTNCSGTPKVCQPLWTGSIGTPSQAYSPMAVANNTLFIEGKGALVALDATGSTNCSGTPKVCQPLWTSPIGTAQSSSNLNSAPAVGNGVVYIGSDDHKLYAFDATGSANCSGTPKTCQPLGFGWTTDVVRSSPSIVNGVVYVGSNDGNLYAFGDAAIYVDVTGSSISNMTSSPALNTPFSTATHDYAVSCPSFQNNSVTFNMTAASGNISAWGQSGSSISVTVTGLAASQAVVIQAPDPSNPSGPPTQYWVRCLPPDFPQLQVSKPGHPTPGYYFYGNLTAGSKNASPYAMILDDNGTPVWFSKTSLGNENVNWLGNNTVMWGVGALFSQASAFNLLNLSTLTTQSVTAPIAPTDLHEYLVEPNGNRMIISTPTKTGVDLTPLGYGTNQSIFDCVVQEINPQGNLVWSWTGSDHIGINETEKALFAFYNVNGTQVGDPYHCNSVDVDPTGNQVLVSFRDTSGIYDINKTTGNVTWKFSGNSNVHDPGEQYLTIKNDPETETSGQHDARFQSNGDVSAYDDHTAVSGAARAVQYKIDTVAGTATLDFSYANPDGQNTLATGSFRRDSDGGNVIGWGFHPGSGFTEIDNSGNVLFQVLFPNNEYGYRSIKFPLSAVNINLLRQTVGASAVPAPAGGGSSANAAIRNSPKAAAGTPVTAATPAVTSTTLPCTTSALSSALTSQAGSRLRDIGAATSSGGPSCAKGWAVQAFTVQGVGTINALFEATGKPPAWTVSVFGRTNLCTGTSPRGAVAALAKRLGCPA